MKHEAFARYARYYDLLYREKDYAGEARFVDGLLRGAGAKPGALLDVGCGTGAHAREFARLGWTVTGVDLSSDMVNIATAKTPPESGIEFHVGEAARFALARKFVAATSLFHVASYQSTADGLAAMCSNIRRHLEPGGVFVFDFWHGPGVLADPPTVRMRELEGENLRVQRTATPTHFRDECLIEVHYEMTVHDLLDDRRERFEERHRMRYFFPSDIVAALDQAGFSLDRAHAGLTAAPLDERAWFGSVVAKVRL